VFGSSGGCWWVAVMDGVLMMSAEPFAVAVRAPAFVELAPGQMAYALAMGLYSQRLEQLHCCDEGVVEVMEDRRRHPLWYSMPMTL
jgi:hypothetical protein